MTLICRLFTPEKCVIIFFQKQRQTELCLNIPFQCRSRIIFDSLTCVGGYSMSTFIT